MTTNCCRLKSGQESEPKATHYLMPECSILGESPPLPPSTFFGRNELIEKIVSLAEDPSSNRPH